MYRYQKHSIHLGNSSYYCRVVAVADGLCPAANGRTQFAFLLIVQRHAIHHIKDLVQRDVGVFQQRDTERAVFVPGPTPWA